MKRRYWEEFMKTGRVEDYLFYKGMEACQSIMEKYEDRSSESADNGNRYGAAGSADWRI